VEKLYGYVDVMKLCVLEMGVDMGQTDWRSGKNP